MTGRQWRGARSGGPSRRGSLKRLLAAGAAGCMPALGRVAQAASGVNGADTAAAPNSATPAAARPASQPGLPRLRRGLNLTHWFEYERSQTVGAEELRLLRQHGLDHVRIPVDPVVGGWQPAVGVAELGFMDELRRAIEAALAAGLDVVFDLHATPATKALIEQQPRLEPALAVLWAQIGRALADLPPARLAFELYNEPQYYPGAVAGPLSRGLGWPGGRWPALQQRMLGALREHAPRHLVLLSGNEGGSLKGLRALPLVADAAVAYVFHYYEPFLFTHQGAHWLDPRYSTAGLRSDVRYPAAAQQGITPGLSQPHPRAAQELADHQAAHWGAARVRADFDAAGAHARQHGVRLLCNEFGAIRAQVDAPSRYRWLADVRQAAEANGLGWTLWDYCDIFGVTVPAAPVNGALGRPGAPRTLEPAALQALGLQAGAAAR